jgi:Xaa-Pro aminopeptidase
MKRLPENPTTNPTFPEIPYSEYKRRIEKAQELMEKRELDALLVFDIANIRYYTGHVKANYGSTYGWRRGLVIPRDGKVVFVAARVIYLTDAKTLHMMNSLGGLLEGL